MKAKVFERTLRVTEAETLVAGSVNQYVIEFTFDEAWLDYACEAVFRREDGSIKETLIVGGLAVIPWEAVQEPGYLVIGVYGTKDDQIRPTVWSSPIQVHAGAAQGDPAVDYETTPWQDALTRMGALAQETVDAQEAAEAAQEAAETAQGVAEDAAEEAREAAQEAAQGLRVQSLDETQIARSAAILDAVGIPLYVDNVAPYAEYGLTLAGWYLFAKIKAPAGVTVTAGTQVTGAHAVIVPGQDHIRVAVRFPVAALAQSVTVHWGEEEETFLFRATDLALRNLDSRITFYIYDASPFVTWTYALTADATFAANKKYYTEENGVYTLAEVTAGEAVPENTYYNHSKLHFAGMTRNVTYRLDETVDCPIEIELPEVAGDGYGAWFEIQMRYSDSFSCTLLPPEDVKIGTAQTQTQTAGVNIIDLQYTDVDNVKMWTLLNTHSNIPA